MADLITRLKSNPKALKLFFGLSEDEQKQFLNAGGFNDMTRSDQRQTLKTLLPGFSDRPVKEQMDYLDSFKAQFQQPSQEDAFKSQVGGQITPMGGDVDAAKAVDNPPAGAEVPVEQKLAQNAVTAGEGLGVGAAAAGAATKAGSFAARVKAALQSTPKLAGQAVGDAEMAAMLPKASQVLQTPEELAETKAALGELPKQPNDAVAFTNTLNQTLAKGIDKLPVKKLVDLDRQINMVMEDKSVPGLVRGKLGTAAEQIKNALNAKVSGREEASQLYGDVRKKEAIIDALKSAAPTVGKAVGTGLAGAAGLDILRKYF